MIDLRELRRDADGFLAKLARKGAADLGRELIQVDAAWRAATARVETLRAQQKQQSGRPSETELQERARHKEQLQSAQAELNELERQRKDLLDRVPNPPADDVPDGGENDFAVLREVGKKPSFAFPARDHLELAEPFGWIDVARATKVSGSRFAYRVGDVALLELALYRFALQRVVEQGHTPMLPPVLVRNEAMYGTGFFPTDAVNIYEIERDQLYLVGTSEVPLAAFHSGEVLAELPLRYAAYSTCFRREAGAAGKDTR
ncbi:MAG: hypothetical protein L0Z53_27595, partial [Acidobacteriales bacterium]|nr:hypothetical protein [Terriglobales bacterium]